MKINTTQLIVSAIGAAAAITVAVVQFQPWKQNSSTNKSKATQAIIAGRVIDQVTNMPIRGAEVTIAGRPDVYLTEENGNFRIIFKNQLEKETVRMAVIKSGYIPSDRSISLPLEDAIISLKKAR